MALMLECGRRQATGRTADVAALAAALEDTAELQDARCVVQGADDRTADGVAGRADHRGNVDPDKIRAVRMQLLAELAGRLEPTLDRQPIGQTRSATRFCPTRRQSGMRALRNGALSHADAWADARLGAELAREQYEAATNMTDRYRGVGGGGGRVDSGCGSAARQFPHDVHRRSAGARQMAGAERRVAGGWRGRAARCDPGRPGRSRRTIPIACGRWSAISVINNPDAVRAGRWCGLPLRHRLRGRRGQAQSAGGGARTHGLPRVEKLRADAALLPQNRRSRRCAMRAG